jgi:hypothetical protein
MHRITGSKHGADTQYHQQHHCFHGLKLLIKCA